MPLRKLGSGLALSSSAATRVAALLYSVELPPPATYSNAPNQSCLCVMVVPALSSRTSKGTGTVYYNAPIAMQFQLDCRHPC